MEMETVQVESSSVERYLNKAKVPRDPDPAAVVDYAASLSEVISKAAKEKPQADRLAKLLSYRVPAMTPDGCTRLDGSLDPTPYDLGATLRIKSNDTDAPAAKLVTVADTLIGHVTDDISINWLGLYQRRTVTDGNQALVKIAYRGIESRAEFPLSEEFAKQSNNTAVGLNGEAVVINDIEKYLSAQGGPYYQCDMLVHSEACLPVYSTDFSRIIGIIDAESYDRNKFSAPLMAKLAAAAIVSAAVLESVE